jgi:hypothetical protein
LNNPLVYTDPSGEFWQIIVGAVIGGVSGAMVGRANGAKGWSMFGYILGGAAIGAFSGLVGGGVTTGISDGGGVMAGTMGLIMASYVSSIGMSMLSKGATSPGISLGVVSYDFINGRFGYLGKKGNEWYQNLGYGLGALANLRDIADLPFFKSMGEEHTSKITKVGDAHSHTAWKGEDGSRISFGPEQLEQGNMLDYAKAATLTKSTTNFYYNDDILTQSVSLNKYAVTAVNGLGKVLPYNVFSLNCVNMQSIAYWLSGIPNIGLHPYILYATSYLYQNGFRPDLYSYWLTNY